MEDQADTSIARKLRPRRSVLSDISNKIADKFADVTKKVTTKKRKLSVSISNMVDLKSFFITLSIGLLTGSQRGWLSGKHS